MIRLARTELKKIKRSSIVLVGFIMLICAPMLTILQQESMNTPVEGFGFQNLINTTIWYNMSFFMPVTITLIGGYMMDREYVDDTLKNLMVIPISYRKLLMGKLAALAVLTITYSVYSFSVTTMLCVFFYQNGLSFSAMLYGLLQIVGMGICIYISVLPIVGWCSGKKNRFFAGSVAAFLYGIFSIPIAGHNLQDKYPVSAGLSIIRYSGDTGSDITNNQTGTAVILLTAVLILTFAILCVQNRKWSID